ncbi:hypothetical protein EJ08DRAFT_654357 [Tothia fuscella]|uniref:Uncharacterized protein n=1 Tax=Tothia fuscella TaxID=1048955 RepID=A0A9P4TST2_9PEZI|nr:hypothetical protein EJ08DRAFT_654357 [Tothia fuscella]
MSEQNFYSPMEKTTNMDKLHNKPSNTPRWKTITAHTTVPLLAFAVLAVPITLVMFFGEISKYSGPHSQCGASSFSKESLLAPDVTFGNFTITEVRLIDLSWNLAAGRGLQASMAFFTYKSACAGLLRLAEGVPVSYRAFEAITISRVSFTAIAALARAVWSTRYWRAKFTFAFVLLSTIFIMILPTLFDIMTGYVQNSSELCELFADNSIVSTLRTNDSSTLEADRATSTCYVMRPVMNNAPVGRLLCVPDTGYRWGCSAIWLIINTCLMSFWAFGSYGIWVDAHRFSVLHRNGRKLGTWRAITDLAKAIEEDVGSSLSGYSNEELEKEVDAAPPVMYTVRREADEQSDTVVLGPK